MNDHKFEYNPESQLKQMVTTAHVFDKQLPPLIYNNNHQASIDLQQQQPNNNHHHIQQSQQQQLLQPKLELIEPSINNLKNIIGRISSQDKILFITDKLTKIGRSSTTSTVEFNVGKNRYVSRRHLHLKHEQLTGDFFMTCTSKNGIFIDGKFFPKTVEPIRLTKECTFRFASTDLRVKFENLYNPNKILKSEEISPKTEIKTENENVDLNNIKLEGILPKHEIKSPIRTQPFISCPTSPAHSFQDYSNSTSNNDLFQTPSTSGNNDDDKPPYSYAQLIVQSITAATDKQLTLSGIYSFIASTYSYYRNGANKGWQNSIRHNLSLNRCFIKVPRSQDEPGKGSFWRIDPTSEMKLIDQSFKKRRQRFRNPLGMPRSAPVSPSAIDLLLHFGDNSSTRGNSPVNDITMNAAESSGSHFDNTSYESQIKQCLQGGSQFNSSYFSTPDKSVKREYSGDMIDDNYSDSAED